jgi:hypothetical protein
MTNMKFKFFSDPGHGWLRVDVQTAESVGLTLADFTPFSYQWAHWLYLEEDVDASTFFKAYMAKYNRPPVIEEEHSDVDSVVRNYPRIAA